ncbi:hypothetical protein OROGR_021618 [Orobanche gracilis]
MLAHDVDATVHEETNGLMDTDVVENLNDYTTGYFRLMLIRGYEGGQMVKAIDFPSHVRRYEGGQSYGRIRFATRLVQVSHAIHAKT